MKKIQVYTPLPEAHAPSEKWQRYLIHPLRIFWGDGSDRWEEYRPAFSFYADFFVPTSDITEADVFFLPFAINYYLLAQKLPIVDQCYQLAQEHGIRLYIWIEGDFDLKQHYPHAIYLKNSSFGKRNFKNEIIRPGDVQQDLLHQYCEGQLAIRKKNSKPLVGFDGLAAYPVLRLIGLMGQNFKDQVATRMGRRAFDPPPIVPLLLRRRRLLTNLAQHPHIDTCFNLRTAFAQGTRGNDSGARQAFIQSIIQTDYTLCVRGSANYSLRFYETLCLGRIPLFLQTDCVLPFEEQIHWKEVVAWVDEKDERYIGEALLDFHRSLSERDFAERQRYCREIWETYLSKKGFAQKLAELLHHSINQ